MSSPPLILRSATSMDANAVIASINAICEEGGAFYTTHFIPSGQWKKVLYTPEKVPDHLLLIAEHGTELVGAVRLFPGEQHTLFRHVGELGMYVLMPYRNKGIGTRLLSTALNWAIQAKIEKITLSVFETNRWAIHLYQKFGFVEEGRRRRQLKIGDQYIDYLWMALFLDP